MNKLRSVLNTAVRFIYSINDRSVDLLPYYKKAHILSLDQRIFFKVCLLAYKAVHGISPGYIRDLIEAEIPSHAARTRSKEEGDYLRLKIPKLLKNKGDVRRFSSHAPVAWNSLPLSIRALGNIDTFKGKLKNLLYSGYPLLSC